MILVEIALFAALVWIVVSQIALPFIQGTPLFPRLRTKRHVAARKIEELNERAVTLSAQDYIDRMIAELDQLEKPTTGKTADPYASKEKS